MNEGKAQASEPGKRADGDRDHMTFLRAFGGSIAVALLLTLVFWGPLWSGSGFIGGDLYPYFFPQKAFLADRLHAGEFPLWNNLTGFGYPVLGESQTGAAYPFHLLTYGLFDVNTAYNIEHLLHYVVCFVGTVLFARSIGLRTPGSLLTAVVFTYGWFPSRACLEWAILTGAWMPVCLWCVECFIQTRWWRYAIGLSLAMGLQLLGGHFHLAFITQLLIVAYGAWRVWMPGAEIAGCATRGINRSPVTLGLLLAIMGGFLLAAVQLLPAWELKGRSSRATVGRDHEPSYGHLPPLYVSQLVAPWLWYSPLAIDGEEGLRSVAELGAPWHWFGPHRNLDELLMQSRAGGLTETATNKVEAHLYCGLVPAALALWWTLGFRRRPQANKAAARSATKDAKSLAGDADNSSPSDVAWLRTETRFWVICGVVAVIYATGWLLPVARYLPGFNFFRGPGRYGIVTTLGLAVLAGRGLTELVRNRSTVARVALAGCVLWSTVCDLWLTSRMVTYAVMVPRPAINYRNESPIRQMLLADSHSPRLYAPGQNVCNLLGVSCLPVYLGIAPAAYSDPRFAGQGMPKATDDGRPVIADADFSEWLDDCGVTHLLSFYQLDESSWKAKQVWQGLDPLLNRAWGRSEPLFLYRFKKPGGRAIVMDSELETAEVASQRETNSLVLQTQLTQARTVLLRELSYPGWKAAIDEMPKAFGQSGPYRVIDVPEGQHRVVWKYQPSSVRVGLGVSLITLFVLAGLGHVRFWHFGWTERLMARLRR